MAGPGCWLGWLAAGWAGEPAFLIRHFGVEAGLPHPAVRAIAQAEDGHLWVATPAGVARFDGLRFEGMAGSAGDTPREVTALGPAAGGGMWAGTAEGGLWHWREGAWRQRLADGAWGGDSPIERILEDGRRGVWLQRGGAVARYEAGALLPRSDAWQGGPFQLDALVAGKVRVVSRQGLWEVLADDSLAPVFPVSEAAGMRYLGETPGGRHWLAGADGLRLCRTAADLEQAPLLPPPLWCEAHRRSSATDASGGLWVGGTCEGLVHVSTGGDPHRLGRAEGLASEMVLALFRDREGLIWVGTHGGGLGRISPKVFSLRGTAEGVGAVSALHADGGGRLFGVSRERGIFQWFEDRLEWIAQPMARTPQGENPVEITALELLKNGALLAGTTEHGLLEIRQKQATLITDLPDPDAEIHCLLAEADGSLWLGREGAAALLRVQDGSLEAIPLGEDGVAVRCLLRAADGTLWAGTERHGLYRWKDAAVSAVSLPPGIRPVGIRALAESGGTIWIATAGAGLWRWKGERLRACREADGLPEDHLTGLAADGRGGLWVAGEEGWFHLDEAALHAWYEGLAPCPGATRFGKEDGLAGWRPAAGGGQGAAAGPDGRLWFAADVGWLEVSPWRFRASTAGPRAAVEALLADGEVVSAAGRLPRGTRRLELRYKGLLMAAPEGLRYQTRLHPLESEWQDQEGRTSVEYTRLGTGRHRFLVRAVDGQGRLSEHPAAIAFELPPPWWREPWVAAAGVLCLVVLVAAATRTVMGARMRREAARAAIERALLEERARISRDMHDDISVGLTELALLGDRLAEQAPAGEAARTVSHRSRELMEAMNETIWLLNPRQDSLEDMASFLQRSVRRWTAASGLACRFDFCGDFSRQSLPPEARRSILLVCKEAVHNVIRHAQARRILVVAREEDACFIVRIEDDGRGLHDAGAEAENPSPGGGNGLPNMRHRIESVGGRIWFESPPQGGTIVSLVFPCKSRLPVTQPLQHPDS